MFSLTRLTAYFVLLGALGQLTGCASVAKQEDQLDDAGIKTVNYSLDEQLLRANRAYREARLTDAEQIYLTVADEHPTLSEVWLRLGNIYTRQGQLEAALRTYKQAIRHQPEDGRAWYNLALVHVKQAVTTLEHASANLPADSGYLKNISGLHDSLLNRTVSAPAGGGDEG